MASTEVNKTKRIRPSARRLSISSISRALVARGSGSLWPYRHRDHVVRTVEQVVSSPALQKCEWASDRVQLVHRQCECCALNKAPRAIRAPPSSFSFGTRAFRAAWNARVRINADGATRVSHLWLSRAARTDSSGGCYINVAWEKGHPLAH